MLSKSIQLLGGFTPNLPKKALPVNLARGSNSKSQDPRHRPQISESASGLASWKTSAFHVN